MYHWNDYKSKKSNRSYDCKCKLPLKLSGLFFLIVPVTWHEMVYSNYLFVHCSGDPTHEERSQALATALAKIFWRAGENKTAVVTM